MAGAVARWPGARRTLVPIPIGIGEVSIRRDGGATTSGAHRAQEGRGGTRDALAGADQGRVLQLAGRTAPGPRGAGRRPRPDRTGWSVLVRGEATDLTDPAELARVGRLPLYPWAPGAKGHYIRILQTLLTGRRIALPDAPSNWWG